MHKHDSILGLDRMADAAAPTAIADRTYEAVNESKLDVMHFSTLM